MKAFSIRDVKAEGFNTPFFQHTFGLAERAFKEACNDPSTQIAKNKEDFSLYYVGEFDFKTGVFTPLQEPKLVAKAD